MIILLYRYIGGCSWESMVSTRMSDLFRFLAENSSKIARDYQILTTDEEIAQFYGVSTDLGEKVGGDIEWQ